MSRNHLDLSIYREKASNKEINWRFLKGLLLYKDRLVFSARQNPWKKLSNISINVCLQLIWDEIKRVDYYLQNISGSVWVAILTSLLKNARVNLLESPKTPAGPPANASYTLRPWYHLFVDFKYMPIAKDDNNDTFNIIDKLMTARWSTACNLSTTSKDAVWMFHKFPNYMVL